jgi:glycosyltransferase involved in cell wall biosynthesis
MKIAICTPTYNERENIRELYLQIKNIFKKLNYDYEHIVIDNNSNDGTVEILKEISSTDKKFKVILNSKNYGHIKSPFYGLLQTNADATILMASDFQDPVELIPQYIEKWKNGSKIVLAEKITSDENNIIFSIRRFFYKFLNKISDTKLYKNTTGAGIFDKKIIDKLREINDPYPYFRGLLSEIGEDIQTIKFNQPKRHAGKTKNNFFTLYDIGMLGIVKHSRMPLRIMILIGFLSSFLSFGVAIFYFFFKIFYWASFDLGIAPLVIGIFIFASIQILLIGIIGEYIGVILLHQRNMPLVIEKERINFD